MTNDNNRKLLGMLGLAQRARMLCVGCEQAVDSARRGKAKILIVAKDASSNTKKRVFNCAKYYEIPCYETYCSQDEFSKSLGKGNLISSVAVCDMNMAKGISKLLNEDMSKADGSPWEV